LWRPLFNFFNIPKNGPGKGSGFFFWDDRRVMTRIFSVAKFLVR
jgi:hypothetical protein